MSKDCFFYTLKNNEDVIVTQICIDCKAKNHSEEDFGWFWEGSEKGYGDWVYLCRECQCIIHDPQGK